MLSKRKGFTLIELLVVMAILAILSTVAFGQYRISQLKARDAQRKGDIGNIARGLEMYYNDNQAYPLSDAAGRMSVSQSGSPTALDWGSEFATDEVIYMKVLPRDPTASGGNLNYCYQSDGDGSYYKIFVKLENDQDKDFDFNRTPAVDYSCLGDSDYNYGISSVNVTVE